MTAWMMVVRIRAATEVYNTAWSVPNHCSLVITAHQLSIEVPILFDWLRRLAPQQVPYCSQTEEQAKDCDTGYPDV